MEKISETSTRHSSCPSATTDAATKSRSKIVTQSGYLFIATNFLLGIFNIVVGLISGSLAITSDAAHSFIDAIAGFIIVLGEKLANHHKLTNHRVKIERISTIIIALIIVATGIDIVVEAIEKFTNPDDAPDYSVSTLVVLIASLAAKYLLAAHLKRTGHKVNSKVLVASGAETMNDAWISIAVLASAIIYLITKVDIEAYVSLAIALVIIKVGFEFIFPHLSRHHHHHLESDPDHDHCGKQSKH